MSEASPADPVLPPGPDAQRGDAAPHRRLEVSIANQRLRLLSGDAVLMDVAVSTAEKGAGNRSGSFQTPLGRHRIRACIGAGAPLGAVFIGRRPTGEIYSSELAAAHPTRDWILTRILWLCGCEPGINRLGKVDSQRRYIYIHGTPDTEPVGIPRSHGCIRMRNGDVAMLFDLVDAGTPVDILA